jgi:hypothetical protein
VRGGPGWDGPGGGTWDFERGCWAPGQRNKGRAGYQSVLAVCDSAVTSCGGDTGIFWWRQGVGWPQDFTRPEWPFVPEGREGTEGGCWTGDSIEPLVCCKLRKARVTGSNAYSLDGFEAWMVDRLVDYAARIPTCGSWASEPDSEGVSYWV